MRIEIAKDTIGWNDPGWAILLIGGVAALIVHYIRPVLSLIPPCAFHALTGMPCLSCGSTRALAALLEGEISAAVHQQPLFVVACLIALVIGLRALSAMMTGRRLVFELTRRDRLFVRCVSIAAILVNWAYLLGTER